ncbi:hypothetical protein F2Q70_00010795 [Brassica cretica]|uniref:Uncharacterized protein n=1 Tax=Brassica cretica TaxID=69181 RepID=A0A8S9M6A5_BRACR|nr:hypothetical protein F2Q70_00010795 [Brassica cretica]
MANRLKPLNEEEQAVERIEGNGGVRAPSLVVGGLKDGDEASLERIHHLVERLIMLIIETLTDFTHVEDVFLTEPSLGIGLEKAVNSASFSRYLDLESKILHATTWTQRQLQRRSTWRGHTAVVNRIYRWRRSGSAKKSEFPSWERGDHGRRHRVDLTPNTEVVGIRDAACYRRD